MFVCRIEDSTDQSSKTTDQGKYWELPNTEIRRLAPEF